MEVEEVLLNDSLDLPGGDWGAVCLLVKNLELHLPPAEMSPPESKDAKLLRAGDLPLPRPPGPPALLLKGFKVEWVVSALPLVQALTGNAEVTAGQGGISRLPVEIHPGEAALCLPREAREGCEGGSPRQNE